MSIDVKGTLENYVKNNALAITSDIQSQFGAAIGTAISQIFSGSISLGAGFTLTGDASTATITGTGSAPPLLSGYQVTAVFTTPDGNDDVTLTFNAKIVTDIQVSQAWPSLLNEYPFTELVFTGGTASLTVDPGAESFKFKISPSIQFEGASLAATGLLEMQYEDSTLGFLGGAVVSGSWTPFKDIPVLSSLTFTGDLGAFFSTITEDDLSDFSTFPGIPKKVTPGLTIFSSITMGGDLASIAKFIAGNANLDLTAIVPLDGGLKKASVSASLVNTSTPGDFEISNFTLTWQSTSADSGNISLSIEAVITISSTQTLDVIGTGDFTYGPQPSLSATLELTGNDGKGWVEPFGIPNLTIVDILFTLALSPEEGGITIGLQGTIDVGSGDDAVQLTAGADFDDFEVPIFVEAALSSVDSGKSVALSTLIDDFIPELNLSSVPLLNQITFADLSFYACAAAVTFGDKTYQPGIGLTGDISFFGYDLDFAFSLITSPSVAVQAKGSISYNQGPIVISGGGITWLTISGANGAPYPTACIDTTASGYCTCSGGITNAYFCVQGSLTFLGLASVSVVAAAAKDLFELDVDLSAGGNVFQDKLHVYLDLDKSVFAASTELSFDPGSITIGPWGVIPQFTISGPSIDICLALGTTMPTSAPCSDGWMPSSAPFFHFDLKFSWGVIDFDLEIDLEINGVTNAFSNFGQFILDWLLNNPGQVLGFIVSSAELLARCLIQLGYDVAQVAAWIVEQIAGYTYDAAFAIASDAWDLIQQICSTTTADQAMAPSTTATPDRIAPYEPVPGVLADLAASPRGHAVLYHYYLHRDEAERLLRSHPQVVGASQQLVTVHKATPAYEHGAHLSLVIDLLKVTAQAGSPAYKASAQELIVAFEPYRDKTYEELLEILHRE